MKIVELSNGQKVHIEEKWNHGLEKTFRIALVSDENKAKAIYAAYEAVYPLVIAKIISKDGKEIPYSVDWLGELPEADYQSIQIAVDDLGERGKGEKKRADS